MSHSVVGKAVALSLPCKLVSAGDGKQVCVAGVDEDGVERNTTSLLVLDHQKPGSGRVWNLLPKSQHTCADKNVYTHTHRNMLIDTNHMCMGAGG